MGSRGGEEEPSALFEEEETDPSLANSSEKVCASPTPNTKQAHRSFPGHTLRSELTGMMRLSASAARAPAAELD